MCPGMYCLCQETILKGHFIWLVFCGNCWLLLNRMNYTNECKQGCYIIDTMPFQWQAGRSTESSTKPLNPVTGAELNHCANGFNFSYCWNEKSWNEPKSHFIYNIQLVGFNFPSVFHSSLKGFCALYSILPCTITSDSLHAAYISLR